MGPIAKRFLFGVLAAAEKDFFGFTGLIHHRTEFTARMAAVTERLLAAFAAAAPEIFPAFLDVNGEGGFLSNNRLRHDGNLLCSQRSFVA